MSPSSAGSLVLLAGRQPLLDPAASDGAHLVPIGLPDLQSARELLERRLTGRSAETAGTRLMDEIIELCGRLPLAIALLAARLTARPNLSLATVATDLRQDRRALR